MDKDSGLPLSKGKPCKYWRPHQRSGCRDGGACSFVHVEPSSEPCRHFAKGQCKLEERCPYVHTVDEKGVAATSNGGPTAKADAAASAKDGKSSEPPEGAAKPLDEAYVAKQKSLGAQSCRGLGKPDLSPLRGNPHAESVFKEMLARERALSGEWVVFYHSYNSPALIYELQAAVAKVLFRFGAKHGVLPRLLKKPFMKLPDADAVVKAFPSWTDQDHNPAFKSVGICCSTSLVSHDPEATPTEIFLTGYGASMVSIAVVEKLLQDCGTPKKHVSKLAAKIKGLAVKHGLPQETGSACQGHLLQIFIHRSCVDKWAYASLPYGVLDKSRQPLSKHLATGGTIVGQARVIVNPSAFMRARSVRLHAYSADAGFHGNRSAFQDALFEILAPILGSMEVRQTAAKGIYGGELPAWWKDLETEKADNMVAETAKAETEETDSSKPAIAAGAAAIPAPNPPRMRCRYGAECRRANPEHHKEFSHPCDADWDALAPCSSVEKNLSACNDKSLPDTSPTKSSAPAPHPSRPRCRYGAECYRKGAEHRNAYSHPGDRDWTENDKSEDATTPGTNSGDDKKLQVATPKVQDCSSKLPLHLESRPARSCTSFADTPSGNIDRPARTGTSAPLPNHHVFKIAPKWLSSLDSAQSADLSSDLEFMATKFALHKAMLIEKPHALIQLIACSADALEQARQELVQPKGLLEFYGSAVRSHEEGGQHSWDNPPIAATDVAWNSNDYDHKSEMQLCGSRHDGVTCSSASAGA